jgi:methylmalonyl-CoA mutase C-terminal domain/subunit
MSAFPNILKLLENEGADDIIVVGGGVISEQDSQALKEQGVAAILSQDTPPEQIVDTIRQLVERRGPR